MATASPERRRRPQNQLKDAMTAFLTQIGRPASISEIKAACEPQVGKAPDSSYRSSLQDQRRYARISRGVFTLADK